MQATTRTPTFAPSRQFTATPLHGLTLFGAAKAADVASTWLLFQQPGFYEANPIFRTLFGAIGLAPGLVVAFVVSLAVVGGLAELAVFYARHRTADPARWVPVCQLIVYGLTTAITMLIVAHNTLLMAGYPPLLPLEGVL